MAYDKLLLAGQEDVEKRLVKGLSSARVGSRGTVRCTLPFVSDRCCERRRCHVPDILQGSNNEAKLLTDERFLRKVAYLYYELTVRSNSDNKLKLR
jgi:hypothetical protein